VRIYNPYQDSKQSQLIFLQIIYLFLLKVVFPFLRLAFYIQGMDNMLFGGHSILKEEILKFYEIFLKILHIYIGRNESLKLDQ